MGLMSRRSKDNNEDFKVRFIGVIALFIRHASCALIILMLSSGVSARDLQWRRGDERQSVSIRRVSGDALAIRQRVVVHNPSQRWIITELSHLTSGCALNLMWRLPSQVEGAAEAKPLLSTIQRGSTRIARKLAKSRWPKGSAETKSFKADLTLPREAALEEVKWYGCGWSALRGKFLSNDQSEINQSNLLQPSPREQRGSRREV